MVIESMMSHGIGSQASIGKALNPDPITTKAINRSSILVNGIKSKTHSGKAINRVYWSLPNNRLKLMAPSVHAFDVPAQLRSLAGGKKRAPRPAA
jgi:hypothetical protein